MQAIHDKTEKTDEIHRLEALDRPELPDRVRETLDEYDP